MKTIQFARWLLVGAFLCAAYIAVSSQVPEKDTQDWNDFQLTVPMTKKVDFLVQGTLRLDRELAYDVRWGAGFNYKVNQYLTLNQSFFSGEARPPNGLKTREVRLTFGATLQKPIGKFTLFDRNGFERRWRAPQIDVWRYRNRVRLERPFTIGKTRFTGLISDEVF